MKLIGNGDLLLCCLCLMMVCFGCEKRCDDSYNTVIDGQEIVRIYDIDNDGIEDFIRCDRTVATTEPIEDLPLSRGLCGNEGLKFLKQNHRNYFLKVGDRIQEDLEEDFSWTNEASGLLLNHSCNGLYRDFWRLSSDISPPYFLAIKKTDSSGVQLGWIELGYDIEAGTIQIMETELRRDVLLVFE